jgi:hypothetical protein
MFANPFFQLKIGRFKATALGRVGIYRCKIRFSDPADFAKLGFQFDSEAENRTANCRSSFKDPDLTKRYLDPY